LILLLGVVGVIWFGFWWRFSYERPATCPSINEKERIYIEESIGETSSLATKVIIQEYLLKFNFYFKLLNHKDVD
jgi:hypothetical protein